MEMWDESAKAEHTNISEISASEVDENIAMALRAIAKRLSASPGALTGEPEPFADELALWVREGLITAEGVKLTREEFRRRLEALKARFAGQAVRLRISEAADQLEADVLNRV